MLRFSYFTFTRSSHNVLMQTGMLVFHHFPLQFTSYGTYNRWKYNIFGCLIHVYLSKNACDGYIIIDSQKCFPQGGKTCLMSHKMKQPNMLCRHFSILSNLLINMLYTIDCKYQLDSSLACHFDLAAPLFSTHPLVSLDSLETVASPVINSTLYYYHYKRNCYLFS